MYLLRTCFSVGTEERVDTKRFRQATWNYIHVLFGLFHDDYRYDEVVSRVWLKLQIYFKIIL